MLPVLVPSGGDPPCTNGVRDETCGGCRFWRCTADGSNKYVTKAHQPTVGHCLARPPQAVVQYRVTTVGQTEILVPNVDGRNAPVEADAVYPRTGRAWPKCGLYEPRTLKKEPREPKEAKELVETKAS